MLDAQPAANAPARPPTVQHLHTSPAIADTAGVRSKPAALLAAATALLPNLEAGRALDAKTLREAMSAAFGASDTQGAWVWKDAYEAAEAVMVLFIQRYGRLMRREAGAGPGSASAMLAMLETLAALEPSQTRRSEEQLALQQFSTPLPLAYAALQAAAIRPGDIVLEPSAGTGMLAVMAECALGKHAGGALHLNEIAALRAGLLAGLFKHAPVTRHNAEAIADYLPSLRPTVVLMNPPFSASPGVQRIRHDADLRHLRAAFSMLPAGGRLVAITSAGCIPGDAAWSRAFERLDPPPRTVFSIAIDGHAYARRGTTFDTRLTVIDRDPANAQGVPVDARASVPTAAGLLAAIAANVPQRQAVVPISAALVPAADLFGHAAARPAPRKRTAATAPNTKPTEPQVRDWGPVAELDYETSPANPEAGVRHLGRCALPGGHDAAGGLGIDGLIANALHREVDHQLDIRRICRHLGIAAGIGFGGLSRVASILGIDLSPDRIRYIVRCRGRFGCRLGVHVRGMRHAGLFAGLLGQTLRRLVGLQGRRSRPCRLGCRGRGIGIASRCHRCICCTCCCCLSGLKLIQLNRFRIQRRIYQGINTVIRYCIHHNFAGGRYYVIRHYNRAALGAGTRKCTNTWVRNRLAHNGCDFDVWKFNARNCDHSSVRDGLAHGRRRSGGGVVHSGFVWRCRGGTAATATATAVQHHGKCDDRNGRHQVSRHLNCHSRVSSNKYYKTPFFDTAAPDCALVRQISVYQWVKG